MYHNEKIHVKMWIISLITREMLIKLIIWHHHLLNRVVKTEMITENVDKTREQLELPFYCFLLKFYCAVNHP